MTITPQKFGKDHWSLLAYIEDRCVHGDDGIGKLSRIRLRCNPKTHPTQSCGNPWSPNYATRLKGFFQFDERNDLVKACNAGLQVHEHDDWDCVDDLEAAGYIEILSMINGYVSMTELGQSTVASLRKHKADGGMFDTYSIAQ